MTLTQWKEEVADMPVFDQEIGWYDMETGIAFNPNYKKAGIDNKKLPPNWRDTFNYSAYYDA